MASRLLASSGGDHTTIADWEAWVTDAANFNSTDWDDTMSGNGGDQTLRFAGETFALNQNVIDADALATATYFKVTFRPNTEGSVVPVGQQIETDGTMNIPTLTAKTPRVQVVENHFWSLDLTDSPNVEWHIEDLFLGADNAHRHGCIKFPTAPQKDVYLDRCFLRDNFGGGVYMISGGAATGNPGRIFVRSCALHLGDAYESTVWNSMSGAYLLGNTIYIDGPTTGTAFLASGSQLPVYLYGNAFFKPADGSLVVGSNISGSDFQTGYNISNMVGADWENDFGGIGDVSNSTRAAMFVSISDHNPLDGGSLYGAVTWSELPSGVRTAWSDTDFYGNTIVKSGRFTAGCIYIKAIDIKKASGVALVSIKSVAGVLKASTKTISGIATCIISFVYRRNRMV